MTKDTSPLQIQNNSFPSLSKGCPRKLIPFFEKLEKMTHLFSMLMSLLSHRDWEAIDDGSEGGKDRYLLHLQIIS